MNLMSLKNLTEHVMDSGPGSNTIKNDIEKLKQEASNAMTKQSLISDSKSLVKLSPSIWRINYGRWVNKPRMR